MFKVTVHMDFEGSSKEELLKEVGKTLLGLATPGECVCDAQPKAAVEAPVPAEESSATEPASAPAPAQKAAPAANIYTLEDVRLVLNDLRKKKGTAVIKAILKEFGAENLPTLNSAHYDNVVMKAFAEMGETVDAAE